MSTISFNPVLTTNAAGSFNVSSTGYIQGIALDQPAIRNSLAGGILADDETLPMWGGVGIYEKIPTAGARDTLGGVLGRSTALAGAKPLIGFSVFDQDHSMINTPQSPVPLAGSRMGVNFYRLGSGARIAVKCDPALVNLEGGLVTQQVSWDFDAQQLIAYNATPGALPVKVLDVQVGNSMTVSFDAITGFATWDREGTTAILLI